MFLRFLKSEDGAASAEYAVIMAVCSFCAIAATSAAMRNGAPLTVLGWQF